MVVLIPRMTYSSRALVILRQARSWSGYYDANAHRGKGRKSEPLVHKLVIVEEEWRKNPRRGWAEIRRKVCKVDPLVCPLRASRLLLVERCGEVYSFAECFTVFVTLSLFS